MIRLQTPEQQVVKMLLQVEPDERQHLSFKNSKFRHFPLQHLGCEVDPHATTSDGAKQKDGLLLGF